MCSVMLYAKCYLAAAEMKLRYDSAFNNMMALEDKMLTDVRYLERAKAAQYDAQNMYDCKKQNLQDWNNAERHQKNASAESNTMVNHVPVQCNTFQGKTNMYAISSRDAESLKTGAHNAFVIAERKLNEANGILREAMQKFTMSSNEFTNAKAEHDKYKDEWFAVKKRYEK